MGVCSPIIVRISHYWIGEGFRLLWYSFPVMIQFLDKNWPTFLILTLSLERGLIWPNNKMAFYGLKWPKRANYLACYRCLEAATAEPAAEEHLFSFFRGRFQTLHTDLARPRRAPGGGWVVVSDALWQRGTAQYLPPSPPVPVPSGSTLAHRDGHLGWTAHSRGLGNQILSRTVLSSHPNRQFLGFHPTCVCHKVNRECCFFKKELCCFFCGAAQLSKETQTSGSGLKMFVSVILRRFWCRVEWLYGIFDTERLVGVPFDFSALRGFKPRSAKWRQYLGSQLAPSPHWGWLANKMVCEATNWSALCVVSIVLWTSIN